MERLTHQGEYGPYWDKSVFDKHHGMEEDLIIERLAYYEDLEEQRQSVDTVYLTDITGTIGEWLDAEFDGEIPPDVVSLLRKAYELAVKNL